MNEDVVLEKIKSLHALIDEKFKTNAEQHQAILEQTQKTNGRVTSLEGWKNRMLGAWIVLTIIIMPLFFAYLKWSK